MSQGLRLCCRSIRIGKILVESDADTHEARVVYAKFPDDISQRKVLLMYPIMSKYCSLIFTNVPYYEYVLLSNTHWYKIIYLITEELLYDE